MTQMDHYDRERDMQRQVERLVADALPEVRVLDLELDDPGQTIRLFVDTDGGVTHEVCVAVTNTVRVMLERYSIEVSSPGIDRPLRYPAHFTAARGQSVRVRERGAKRWINAVVGDADDTEVSFERSDGSATTLRYEQIARSHVVATTSGGTA